MKTPEEILSNIHFLEGYIDDYCSPDLEASSNIIKQAQIEAWNEAIDAAAKYVKIKKRMTGSLFSVPTLTVDKQSILKLKKNN